LIALQKEEPRCHAGVSFLGSARTLPEERSVRRQGGKNLSDLAAANGKLERVHPVGETNKVPPMARGKAAVVSRRKALWNSTWESLKTEIEGKGEISNYYGGGMTN